MESKLSQFDRLDSSHNAGYFETNDSDLELTDGETGTDQGGYSSGEEGNKLRELKTKSDQFEVDMDRELSDMIGYMGYPAYMLSHLNGIETDNSSPSVDNANLGFYDNMYFDSDDEEAETASKDSKKRVLSNDELLYDPSADDQDEEWVNVQRMAYRNMKIPDYGLTDLNTGERILPKVSEIPKSDAILSCPGCMVTLCIDCQQHETYKNQFRAMFVMHCRPELGEILKYKKKKPKRRYNNKTIITEETVEYDVYRPVRCDSCQTEVGVYDEEEVYHLYNVLPSEP